MIGRDLVLAGVIAAAWVGAAGASEEGVYHVFQPIETGAGVTIIQVPYLTYRFGVGDPTAEVLLTVQPNVIETDAGPTNRNLAAVEGVRFVTTEGPGPDKRLPLLHGDTLDVQVDLSHLKSLPPNSPDGSNVIRTWQDDVVKATLWCGLRNARARWPVVKWVRYELTGCGRLVGLAGVYSVEPLVPPRGFVEWDGVKDSLALLKSRLTGR